MVEIYLNSPFYSYLQSSTHEIKLEHQLKPIKVMKKGLCL